MYFIHAINCIFSYLKFCSKEKMWTYGKTLGIRHHKYTEKIAENTVAAVNIGVSKKKQLPQHSKYYVVFISISILVDTQSLWVVRQVIVMKKST